MTGNGCDLSNGTKEELVIDKKMCPGLQVFNCSDSLRYFSKETILEQKLGPSTTSRMGSQDAYTVLHYLRGDPEMLFYMMSVCTDEEANLCRQYLGENEPFTVSLYNVIHVLLNWGATPKSLRIDNNKELSSRFIPFLPPTSLPKLPSRHIVKLVLQFISGHLSTEKSADADRERFCLIKVLMTAMLDPQYYCHKFQFDNVIYKVLDTFPDWDEDKASSLVSHLDLTQLGLQNATYICCSFLHAISPRMRDLQVVAICNLLNARYGFTLHFEPFPSLLDQLPPAEIIVERFQMLDMFVLIQLVTTLLTLCHKTSPTCSLGWIEALYNWAQAIHSELMAPLMLYSVEGGLVKEKCVRLQADCVEFWKQIAPKNQKCLGN